MTEPKTTRRGPLAAGGTTETPAKERKSTGAASAASAAAARAGTIASVVTARPKQKLVRDSFTMPKAEYTVLEGLKERAIGLKRPAKKSELLRAGVAVLLAMTDKAFLSALNGVTSLKTGRPKGSRAGGVQAKGTDA